MVVLAPHRWAACAGSWFRITLDRRELSAECRACTLASMCFLWGDSLSSLESEMAVPAVVMQFAQTLEVQRVITLIAERQETSLVARIDPTLSKN